MLPAVIGKHGIYSNTRGEGANPLDWDQLSSFPPGLSQPSQEASGGPRLACVLYLLYKLSILIIFGTFKMQPWRIYTSLGPPPASWLGCHVQGRWPTVTCPGVLGRRAVGLQICQYFLKNHFLDGWKYNVQVSYNLSRLWFCHMVLISS